jgi:Domain of unknown function (DUF222)
MNVMREEGGSEAIDRLGELQSGAERVLEIAPQVMAEERQQVLVRLRHIADVVELAFSTVAQAFAETDEYEAEGSVSPIDWIRHNCRMGAGATADRINVGRQMANTPRSTKAVADGEIGFAHLSLIARTASMVEDSKSSGPFDETVLLEAARETSVGRLWHLCQHVRHAVDPEGMATEQANAVEWRRLNLKQGEDGSLAVDGWFDPEGGATIRSALEPLSQLTGSEDDRSRERRQADALVELSHHGLDAGVLPQRAGQRPHVQVTTSLETLRALVGAPAGEMEFTMPISGETVRRLACDGSITRVVLGSESVVIDVGRAKRVVAGTTRRALDARDRQCQWPGCDRPPSWTAAHHLVHWARGGDTNLSNMVLLCHRHHWLAHEGRWQLVRTDDGRLLTIPPRPWLFSQVRAPDETGAA